MRQNYSENVQKKTKESGEFLKEKSITQTEESLDLNGLGLSESDFLKNHTE
jgi:hypothetical protein